MSHIVLDSLNVHGLDTCPDKKPTQVVPKGKKYLEDSDSEEDIDSMLPPKKKVC